MKNLLSIHKIIRLSPQIKQSRRHPACSTAVLPNIGGVGRCRQSRAVKCGYSGHRREGMAFDRVNLPALERGEAASAAPPTHHVPTSPTTSTAPRRPRIGSLCRNLSLPVEAVNHLPHPAPHLDPISREPSRIISREPSRIVLFYEKMCYN